MNRRPYPLLIAAAALVLALPLVSRFATPASAAAAAAASQDKPDHVVDLTAIEFRPNRLEISKGDTIKFINHDKFQHDVYMVRTANRNVVIVPRTTIEPGTSTTVQINDEGLFTLYCTIHGGMSAKISTTGSFELTEEEKKLYAKVKVIPPIVKIGEALFWDRAQCHRCHKMGERGDGLRGPNLQDIGFRAGATAEKIGLDSGTAYIVQSVMEPSAHLVEGYSDDMIKSYQPPVNLTEQDLKAIITYLQSQGGDVDEWSINIDKQKLDTLPVFNPFAKGDPVHGKDIFNEQSCFSCHETRAHKAISIGPDLSEIGSFRNWAWLAESIIDPNAEVGHNWHGATVFLKPGATPKVTDEKGNPLAAADEKAKEADEEEDDWGDTADFVNGIVRKNSAEEVTLLVSPGRLETYTTDQIERIELDKTSRMAANFAQLATVEQMADLITYLQSLKTLPKKPKQ